MERTVQHEQTEVPDSTSVSRLLREQVPEFSGEPVRPSAAAGSSNWVFRVGDHHAVRLPRADCYTEDLLKESRCLPQLAPELPVRVPEVAFQGTPSTVFPRPWTVVSWVPGEVPGELDQAGQAALAGELGRFVRSLHAVDTHGQRAGAEHWGYRAGEPVTDTIDDWVHTAATALADVFDPHQVRRAWNRIRDVPPAWMPPCWVHADLSAENLLIDPDGHLVGVIDFGALGVGDRAVDLLYAWSMFDQPALEELRSASGTDDATWQRARAWAFAGPGLVTIQSYRHSMPDRAARLTGLVEAVAAEVGVALR